MDYQKSLHVLIIADRLFEQASKLADYFRSTDSIDVVGLAVGEPEARRIAQQADFDYLIIAGYLKNENNYCVIEELQKRQKAFLPVQWAILDSLIDTFCLRYKIPLKFDRTLPMAEFVEFLESHKR